MSLKVTSRLIDAQNHNFLGFFIIWLYKLVDLNPWKHYYTHFSFEYGWFQLNGYTVTDRAVEWQENTKVHQNTGFLAFDFEL